MKRKNINLLIVALILFITLSCTFNSCYKGDGFDQSSITGDIITTPVASDSLPHYLYKRKTDSIERANFENREQKHSEGTGGSFGGVGFYKQEEQFYVALQSYHLDPDVEYFEQNKKNFVREVVWDSVWKVDGGKHARGHYVKSGTPVQFIEKEIQDKHGTVLLPVPEIVYLIFYPLMIVIGLVLGLFLLYHFFKNAVRLFLDIAHGRPFSEDNNRRLLHMAYICFFSGLFLMLMKIIMYVCFSNQIPSNINFSWFEVYKANAMAIVAGLILILIRNAFVDGYDLQKERDLII